MNQTTNYNFNVPVGSDIVNPLVQDFPNWEILDTILRNVANTGVTTATHTKTGTIHTLTFSETTVPMIRFQATGDFNTNDAFTVNGVSVSALTVTGEALPDGAFVIGSMVLCELRDNLLTVYTSGTDANTLEGHAASYFATASDLSTVDGKTDANKTLIDNIETKLSPSFGRRLTNGSTAAGTNFSNSVTIPKGGLYLVASRVRMQANAACYLSVSTPAVTDIVIPGGASLKCSNQTVRESFNFLSIVDTRAQSNDYTLNYTGWSDSTWSYDLEVTFIKIPA